MQTEPSAAIRLTHAPQGLPGECAQCRGTLDNVESRSGRWAFVDTGRHQEFYGNVYYCNLCVEEMARTLGMLTLTEVADVRGQNESLGIEVFSLKTQLAEYEVRFRGFVDAGFCPDSSAHSGSDSLLPLGSGSSSRLPVDEVADGVTPEGAEPVGSGEGEAPESLHDEGVGELRSDAVGDDDVDFSLDLS